MADFDKYAPILRKVEGGWSDDPQDRGGQTQCGVTLNTFRRFFGQDKTADDLRNISNEQWRTIMESYWKHCSADKIVNQSVASIFVDAYVNGGTKALRCLQNAIGVEPDGKVGRMTIGRLNAISSRECFLLLKKERLNYYRRIAEAVPSQRKFLKGWENRLNEFHFSLD